MTVSPRLIARVAAMAWAASLAYQARSLFVVLGVALGAASLTIIVTAVDGARQKALEIVDMFGPDAALVLSGRMEFQAVGRRALTLTMDDARRIQDSLPGAYLVVPMRAKQNLKLRVEDRNYQNDLITIGATENYAQAWNWPLAEGRDLSAEDVARADRVCLMAATPARELFGERSPVGQIVFVGDFPFRVIGALAYRGFAGGGGDIDNRIVVPITTLTQRFNLERRHFRALRVKFHDPERMADHVEALRSLLRDSHRLAPDEPDDFTIVTADEVLKFMTMLRGSLLVFLGVTAIVAMVVGGFVLANLFSLSVAERREEIGLKRALGARASAILLQFLLEAAILTLAGGLLGLGLGLGFGQLLTRLGFLTIRFSWKVFGLALASALAIGLVFGLKPAKEAASLDPIAALRGAG